MSVAGSTAALVAAVLLFTVATLPPRAPVISSSSWQPDRPVSIVAGVIHVHSARSDGTGSVEEIAEAASRAGLNFVIFTDHGDGTRPGDRPFYHAGVLCIDAVENRIRGGALSRTRCRPAPYPLGGDPRDVVEDVQRLGGFGIVAHPDSTGPGLRWGEWSVDVDGIEWLNADSQWRLRSKGRVAVALARYLFRGPESLAELLARPESTLTRWDLLTTGRRVVGIAGSDAHARADLWSAEDPDRTSWYLKIPSYEATFRTFANRVELEAGLTGDAAADSARLLAAIGAGRVYTAIDALGGPALFEFTGTSGAFSATQGDVLPIGGPLMFRARVNGPPEAKIVLFRNGRAAAEAVGTELRHLANPASGTYRVEVQLPGVSGTASIPWVVSNPNLCGKQGEHRAGASGRSAGTGGFRSL